MVGIKDVLQSTINAMTASAVAQPGGVGFLTDVQPRPGEVDVVDDIPGDIDLTWITKNVVFKDDRVETSFTPADLDNAIIAGQALPGLPVSTGVPGLLGQLKGTIPLLSEISLQVELQVRWRVLDDKGKDLDPNLWRTPDGGASGPNVLFLFAPEVVELTTSLDARRTTTKRLLRATVTLKAGGQTVERTLPDVTVPVLPLPIPKVLASFRHSRFQVSDEDEPGFVFILVPSNSPLQTLNALKDTLASVQTTVGTLRDFGGFAAFLLGLDALTNALSSSQLYVVFAASDAISNLNSFTAIQNDAITNDIELEDEISSLIFVGPANRKVDLFCETDFDDENGHGVLTVGPHHYTLVRSLHADHPATDPAGLFEVKHEADGDPGFGDWLSSIRFH